ncbi:hypothetical protein DFH09DRAFT_1380266 [Mycena vulgaris]|nr:hypothetical protein DFH09DRAFT_1380266 [Mycena vulgaris]
MRDITSIPTNTNSKCQSINSTLRFIPANPHIFNASYPASAHVLGRDLMDPSRCLLAVPRTRLRHHLAKRRRGTTQGPIHRRPTPSPARQRVQLLGRDAKLLHPGAHTHTRTQGPPSTGQAPHASQANRSATDGVLHTRTSFLGSKRPPCATPPRAGTTLSDARLICFLLSLQSSTSQLVAEVRGARLRRIYSPRHYDGVLRFDKRVDLWSLGLTFYDLMGLMGAYPEVFRMDGSGRTTIDGGESMLIKLTRCGSPPELTALI